MLQPWDTLSPHQFKPIRLNRPPVPRKPDTRTITGDGILSMLLDGVNSGMNKLEITSTPKITATTATVISNGCTSNLSHQRGGLRDG